MVKVRQYLIIAVLIFSNLLVDAATFTAVQNGDWNVGATWGNPGNDVEGSGYPGINDVARTNGQEVGISTDVSCATLFVLAGVANQIVWTDFDLFEPHTITVGSRIISSSTSGPTVSVFENSSDITFVFTRVGEIISRWSTSAPIHTMIVSSGGVSTVGSSFAIGGGTLTISSGSTLSIGSTYNVSNSVNSTLSISGTLDLAGSGGVNGGATSSNYGTITATSTGVINIGTSAYMNSNNINLNSGSHMNVSNDETSGWWHSASGGPVGANINSNSTVHYDRLGSQGIRAGTYGNLDISSGGAAATKTLSSSGTLTVEGDLYIGASTTFASSNTNTKTIQGTSTIDGIWNVSQPITFNGGGTQIITGANGVTFNDVVIFSNNMDINTDVTFGSTVNTGGNTISFEDDLTNDGTIIASGTFIFDGALTQSIGGASSTLVNNLTVSNSSQTVTVNGGGTIVYGTLTVGSTSTLNANGNLALRSNGSGTARVAEISGSGTITGSVIYQRYINGAQEWHNIGIPVGGSTTDISGSGFPVPGNDLGRYNETVAGDINQGWETADLPFTTISDTRGYSFWTRTANTPGTLTFTGPLNTGNVSLDVNYTNNIVGTDDDDGWNLVNNPYASQIDWGSGSWTKTRIDATIAVWNGSSYIYLNGSGTIASGQAFWVHANAASPVLTAKQGVKTSSGATFYRTTDDVVPDQLSVTLQDGEFSDLARIRFIDDATEEFDTQYDGYKLQNNIFNLSSLSEGGMDLSINTLPMLACSRVVKLNMTNITEGTYQLKFDGLYSFETAFDFTLIDNFLNTSTALSENYSYDFSVTADAASWGSTRFEIEFSAASIDSNVMYSIDNKCGLGSAVLITNAQAGINYILSKNGVIVKSQIASSSTLEFALTQDEVTEGLNQIDLTLDNSGCNNTLLIKNGIEFTVIGVQEITATTNGLSCGTGQVSIKAEGATGNGYYRWYESVETIDPIPNQNSNEYLTPSIDATKFYYVTVVNEYGCESSTRTKVIAEIMNVTQPIISVEGDVISTSAFGDNYIWYKDGLLIEGENTESIAVVESGAYRVEVVTNTCSATSENIIVEILGVKELKEYGIEIYPNPVLDIMTIKSELTINSIFIFDTKGIEVMRIENNIPNEIDMKNIKKGIYIINIATDNQIITYRVRKK